MRKTPLSFLFAGILTGVACLAQTENASVVNDARSTTRSKPDGLRVFTAGHSLHWYVPDILSELATASGIEGHVQVGVQRIGVSRTIQHWQRGTQAKQALKTGKVDVFTMSPIQFPDEGIDKFVKLGLEHNPDMKFTVQISWGGPDIDNQDFSFSALRRRTDREKTPEQIKMLNVKNVKAAEEHIKKINEQYNKQAVFLVPTSAAHEALRIKIYNEKIPGLDRQAELFADNIGHPTPPVQALNAYLHFAVIYGCSPVGLPIPKVLKKARKQEWNDEKFNRSLQELAWETVIKYPPSGVRVSKKEEQQVQLFPLRDVRLLKSPFSNAVEINRQYLLAHDPDRLLAPFRREAGLEPKARPYGNWESGGLDGHTAGHYLSALSLMMASGADPDGEFHRRLDTMINELEEIQKANGNGYIGGIPGSRDYWNRIAEGRIDLMRRKWAPWYNLHKMFAGLRDAYLLGVNEKARDLLVRYGDWCDQVTSGLSDAQMQRMLGTEYGGMNEVLADIYEITGNQKYIKLAQRFNHRAVFEPLKNHQDRLTGLHANTQIPKIVGMERIAALIRDESLHNGAAFFWDTVTQHRSLAFGGNSVSEHFNDPRDFSRVIKHREGPETCNTYNMLRLTKQLFAAEPRAAYADYYERALYNHILASIHPEKPGYVYFTSIRPDHYRVYSQPEHAFWCCVGTGMENPGRYGGFIYARARDRLYVNLFIPSELSVSDQGMVLKQETRFPDEARTNLRLQLEKPATFTLNIRHPAWVHADDFAVKINGQSFGVESTPSSYASIRREWKNGDTIDVELPMHVRVERLPDGSDWVAILYGPIVLVKPDGVENMDGLFANEGRMAHVAHGPMVPLDKVPALLTTEAELPTHVVPDPSAGPLHFRIRDVIEPAVPRGLPLVPFFRLHERRYQMYWELTTAEKVAARREKLAAQERARAAREAATIDSVAVGEQQPEVEHNLDGKGMESGIHNGRRWRHGTWIQYTLDPKGVKEVILAVTYSGDDRGREFDILVNGMVIATQRLTGEKPNQFIEKRYTIPSEILDKAGNDRLTVRFSVKRWLAGGLYDVRLLKPGAPELPPFD